MSIFNRLMFPILYLLFMFAIASWVLTTLGSAAEPMRVAVIDTGLDRTDARFQDKLCAQGHYNFVDHEAATYDTDGHGTYIAALISKYAVNTSYCLVIYKFYSDRASSDTNALNAMLAIKLAIKDGANIVNMSFGGPEFQEQEYLAIKNAPGVIFVTAAGNAGKELKAPYAFYPASYGLKNIVVVGASNGVGKPLDSSNYGELVKVWEAGVGPLAAFPDGTIGTMVGTSISTAIYTGRLISARGFRK